MHYQSTFMRESISPPGQEAQEIQSDLLFNKFKNEIYYERELEQQIAKGLANHSDVSGLIAQLETAHISVDSAFQLWRSHEQGLINEAKTH
jgi:hypothetical protein